MSRKEKKIQDYDRLYATLRHYVDLAMKLSYRTLRYVGRERIPQDGAVIYAPNHTNALMDALIILTMDRKAKVFVARADIFRLGMIMFVATMYFLLSIGCFIMEKLVQAFPLWGRHFYVEKRESSVITRSTQWSKSSRGRRSVIHSL